MKDICNTLIILVVIISAFASVVILAVYPSERIATKRFYEVCINSLTIATLPYRNASVEDIETCKIVTKELMSHAN